jgi:predicted Kef-type K+ transport protein
MDGGKPDGQGARDAAAVLPFLAIILLMPPIILIFARPLTVAGLPLVLIYVFGVWAVAILCAFQLSKRLPGDEAERNRPSGRDESGPG